MGLLEVIQAALSLDIAFFIDLFLNNLFIFFGLYTLMYFFVEKKDALLYTIVLEIILLATLDLETLTGLAMLSAPFLMIYYLTKIAVLTFVENSPGLKPYIIIISTVQYYAAFLFFNLVMGGHV